MSKIIIRRPEAEDGDDIAAIYAVEEVVGFTAQLPYRDVQFWRDFYRTRDPEGMELVAEINDRVVGHLGMILNRAPRRKHVGSFGLCVHADFHGQGVGRALMAEMINLADNWLNLVRLELSVASENSRAIALYRSFGFETEGEFKMDLFRNGRYGNTTQMARLRVPVGS
ncbi:GNAT family N-acetyltransferase [Dickeya dadantii]|uniref:Putative acetyltransferase n=1 Tax=Dickeya dadantii (strain 3937) TaxID=198628 RepID=E0SIG5_DICD3|nr:GNAT family N-acetyltransferase [Dickeya dadantii]ADM97846.1 Putative acetyltransferase [Dickeya dadantii 3937]NPE50756.1 GNAT family N-acetyltransferase [Dickeya dadantii]NPE55018.1 GNAT family N-acetyltransferase [Dickeya dadantii]NPE68609.1 GNAT family N-acetyltransferase [Dickeya dadantii]OOC14048.1 GNAT family N-acetyltransferase [Dickeya dadantii]